MYLWQKIVTTDGVVFVLDDSINRSVIYIEFLLFLTIFFLCILDDLKMNFSIKKNLGLYVTLCLITLLLGIIFNDGLRYMARMWETEEYSHGYLIPVICFWFIWSNREAASQYIGKGSWVGVLVIVIGLIIGLMGELASLYTITQYAFLIVLYGLCFALVGWNGMKLMWFALAYLFFMIPLPTFLYNNLSSQLQLISSQLGVAVIRLFDISVFLQGNVIDMGPFKLQVVEACSGLRYLFPLTSFGFLCAYFFRAKLWMRVLVFLTTLPITVMMNSLRIGVIGILVEYWGIEQAEGFMHDFEGWIIFIGCLAVLFTEMWLLVLFFMPGKSFAQVFVVDATVQVSEVSVAETSDSKSRLIFGLPKSYLAACMLLLIMLPLSILMDNREDLVPERQRFANFPLNIDGWKGVEVGMGQEFIDILKFDDYIIGNYSKTKDPLPVNLYVAYYASQRKGASAHSPKACMPGDGWRIGDFNQRQIGAHVTSRGDSLRVNRTVISKGDNRQLVYYWFQQRGRIITNEYLVKWYLFWDAVTTQRTDGAMIRLVVNLPEGSDVADADKKMASFLDVIFPKLEDFVPS
jgi:exosortase D (VPLPA-CTERM-specific)